MVFAQTLRRGGFMPKLFLMLRLKCFFGIGALAALISFPGCRPDDSATHPSTDGLSVTNYTVTGQVVEIYPERGSILVKHEEILGYMQAMTMPFDVPQTNELALVAPNDVIRFQLKVNEEKGWAEQLQILIKADPSTLPVRPTARVVRDVEPLEVGDKLTDYTLINEHAKSFKLSDYEGKVLAFNFIFTRCPFPNFCPRMVNRFKEAAEKLNTNPNLVQDWQFVTITFDVDYDTPERLLSYAKAYGYNEEYWTFATGELIDIDALTEQVGLMFMREPGSTEFNHNLRTVVVNPKGVVSEILIGNEWETDELIQAMRKAADANANNPAVEK